MEIEKSHKKVEHDIENIEDEILSGLSNLNLLDTFSPDELGMSYEEVAADKQKYFDLITRLQEALTVLKTN